MAKNPSYTRSLTDKFVVKGELSEDGEIIKYVDSDKNPQEITVTKCMEPFRGEAIEFTVTIKMNQDLGDEEG